MQGDERMRCPFCGNVDTQVKDSRPAEDNVAIRRRRFCPACAGRFTTFERVQLREVVVLKRSGKRDKVVIATFATATPSPTPSPWPTGAR